MMKMTISPKREHKMRLKIVFLVLLFFVGSVMFLGCGEREDAAETVETVSPDEARSQAQREITEENLDEEFERLEREIMSELE